MFDSYTAPGKLYKKVVAGFIVITVFATAIFYSYLTKQNSHKSNAAVGDFVSLSFEPATTTVTVGQEYTTKIKYDQSSKPLAVQGYDIQANFDPSVVQITHITYILGKAADGLGDTDASLSTVNNAGVMSIRGEIDSGTPEVLATGREIADVSYKIIAAPVGNPQFQTAVNVTGSMVELNSDNSLNSIAINATSFIAQTANYTPVPTGPVAQCGRFQDVNPGDTFYSYIQCLGCNMSIQGYQCGVAPAGQCVPPDNLPSYLPGEFIKRGQFTKLVAVTAHFSDTIPADRQTFADVVPNSTFWQYVEQAYANAIISGYPCVVGSAEPCDADHRPYFRPNVEVRRDQAVKMVIASSAQLPGSFPSTATFEDVPVGSTYFSYVEEAVRRGLISGYACGGTGEPCDSDHRPYFRPAASLTRGQASKLVAIGLNCVLPSGTPQPNPTGATGNTSINMKLKFQGITSQPSVNRTLNVQVKAVSTEAGKSFVQTVPFTSDASGIWSGTMYFDLDPNMIAQNFKYSLYVKGPMHLKKRVCEIKPTEAAPGTYSCATSDISLSIGSNSVDMSGIYMLTGDLPVDNGQQNGLVDSSDTSYIRTHFGDSSADALNTADLNLDGSIDTQDFSLVLAALGVKYDDPEEQ